MKRDWLLKEPKSQLHPPIAQSDRRLAMRYNDNRFVLADIADGIMNNALAVLVKCACRFVKDKYVDVAQKQSRKYDSLPLSAG